MWELSGNRKLYSCLLISTVQWLYADIRPRLCRHIFQLEKHFLSKLALCYLDKHISNFCCSLLVCLLPTNGNDCMFRCFDLKSNISVCDLSWIRGNRTFASFIISANRAINSSFSALECVLLQCVCQNPCDVRFLNMWREVGRDIGFFDMEPYDTRCASCPRSFAMAVVGSPPTQFKPKRIS